jgi:chemotaxis protein CheY-P-specific phosphatase CheC
MHTRSYPNSSLQKFLNDTFIKASNSFTALTGKEFVISRYFLNFLEGDQFIRQNVDLREEAYFASILQLRDILQMDVGFFISEAEGLSLYNLLYGDRIKKINKVDPDVIAAIGEINNILGSCFVNLLADRLHTEAHPTTPINTFDMLGAILEDMLLQHEYMDKVILYADVLLREKQFGQFHVRFIVISPQEQLSEMIKNN